MFRNPMQILMDQSDQSETEQQDKKSFERLEAGDRFEAIPRNGLSADVQLFFR